MYHKLSQQGRQHVIRIKGPLHIPIEISQPCMSTSDLMTPAIKTTIGRQEYSDQNPVEGHQSNP